MVAVAHARDAAEVNSYAYRDLRRLAGSLTAQRNPHGREIHDALTSNVNRGSAETSAPDLGAHLLRCVPRCQVPWLAWGFDLHLDGSATAGI